MLERLCGPAGIALVGSSALAVREALTRDRSALWAGEHHAGVASGDPGRGGPRDVSPGEAPYPGVVQATSPNLLAATAAASVSTARRAGRELQRN